MNTALLDELEPLYPGETMREVFALAREALAIRDATRVRVTREEHPTDSVLAFDAAEGRWVISHGAGGIIAMSDRYTHWLPLPPKQETP